MRESGHILLISLRNLEMREENNLPRKWTNYIVRWAEQRLLPGSAAGLLMDGRRPCGKEMALEMHRSY